MKRNNSKSRRHRAPRRNPRRGVLLLIILALLAMFAMVAVAFVVLTGHARRGAEVMRKVDQSYDPPAKLLDEAFGIVLRGPALQVGPTAPPPACAITSQSLLEKMYGHDTLPLQTPGQPLTGLPVTVVGQLCNGQLLELKSTVAVDMTRRIGCVLTVVGPLGSPGFGLNARIVGLNPATLSDPAGNVNFHILPFENGWTPAVGEVFTCIISNVPYSGMGFGYNPITGAVDLRNDMLDSPYRDAALANYPISMMPRHRANWDWTATGSGGKKFGLAGGANTEYTAPDYQDPLVAWQIPSRNPDGSAVLPVLTPLPSLHRPELVRFWAERTNPNGLGTNWKNLSPALMRAIMFRPNGGRPGTDHPKFTGSNLRFDPTWDGKTPNVAEWDVDNDGDGRPDSVWVDLGFPVRYTADGRAYKPLFAILCVDLDGRLNLNAQGSLAQTQWNLYEKVQTAETPVTGAVFAGGTSTPVVLPRGQGYGPAEINLLPLLSPTSLPTDPRGQQRYLALMQGNTSLALSGRYGELGISASPLPGISANNVNGPPSPHTWNKWLDYSGNYWDYMNGAGAETPDAYGTPPDIHGFGIVAFDPAGRPMYLGNSNLPGYPNWCSFGGSIMNTPYDIDLSLNAPRGASYAPVDNPFSPGEMERLLRPFDRDTAALPGRLATLLGAPTNTIGLPAAEQWKRTQLTTESWHVPVLNTVLPWRYRQQLGQAQDRPRHFVDWLRLRKIPAPQWPQLLAPELLCGLRMDLNRPLGIILPTGKVIVQPQAPYVRPGVAGDNSTAGLDPSGVPLDPDPKRAAIKARQLLARHIYCLVSLLREIGDIQMFQAEGDLKGTSAIAFEFQQRRLAQWAINAVMFRTSDSIMVPFKYPLRPWDDPAGAGWCMDDAKDPYYMDLSRPNVDSKGRQCGVVWGIKPPELLLTEATAWHDRRVADTSFATPNDGEETDQKRTDKKKVDEKEVPADQDLDQPRMPQGSLFVELYCPRSAVNAAAPRDLYGYDAGKGWYLDLGRMTPDGKPVWRIAVSHSAKKDPTNHNVMSRLAARPDSCSLEPEPFVTVPNSTQRIDPMTGLAPPPAVAAAGRFTMKRSFDATEGANVRIERVISLAPAVPVNAQAAAVTYYNRNGARMLFGGGYAIVGPRPQTAIGSVKSADGKLGVPSPQRIDLSPSGSTVTALAGNTLPYTPVTNANKQIRPALGIVCAADWPSDWVAHGPNGVGKAGIGVSISEPLPLAGPTNYYPEPKVRGKNQAIKDLDGQAPMEWYGDPEQTGTDKFLGSPLESVTNIGNAPGAKTRPLASDAAVLTGTYPAYKTLFLQRIADPTAAYDAINNPYITVDWLPVDLTVFNGEDKLTQAEWSQAWGGKPPEANWDRDDPGFENYKKPGVVFSSRQRGQAAARADTTSTNYFNIWAPLSEQWQPKYSPANASPAIFACDLRHTLGFLNEGFWRGTRVVASPYAISNQIGMTAEPYIGDPVYPFPWITWNERPYASEYEVIQVPGTNAARLGWEFRTLRPREPFDPAYWGDNFPLGHLINFFSSDRNDPAYGTNALPGPVMLRFFDFVRVPSPFIKTDIQIDPAAAGKPDEVGKHWFHPPFNRVSAYREPGRVNINTVSCRETLQGWLNYWPGIADQVNIETNWKEFVRARRSCENDAHGDLALPPPATHPSRFVRYFRAAAGIELQPVIEPRPWAWQPAHEDDITLLRHRAGDVFRPLFAQDGMQMNNANAPVTKMPYYDWDRNTYCRFLSMQRLGPLTTFRSNVFAIWMTVGYFEVEAVPANADRNVYPDGFTLGQELGSDTGEVDRHRAFYMIDRSIPVGFLRGQDLNTDKTILLRRFIE